MVLTVKRHDVKRLITWIYADVLQVSTNIHTLISHVPFIFIKVHSGLKMMYELHTCNVHITKYLNVSNWRCWRLSYCIIDDSTILYNLTWISCMHLIRCTSGKSVVLVAVSLHGLISIFLQFEYNFKYFLHKEMSELWVQ